MRTFNSNQPEPVFTVSLTTSFTISLTITFPMPFPMSFPISFPTSEFSIGVIVYYATRKKIAICFTSWESKQFPMSVKFATRVEGEC